ncbi:phosphatidylserine decarboxylase [Bacillus timonensis]|nr:phosphatidylserine decarboxylase [Bacillus timonensis]
MRKTLYQLMIELTNQRFVSSLLEKFAQSRVSSFVIPSFIKVFNINKTEIEKEIKEFTSLHDLFVRKLKKDARPIDTNIDSVVSPVDAVMEEVGTILPSKEIIVKGKKYSISEMLGDEFRLEKYIDGTFIILYLSPSHYHRIHSPISGEITHQWTLGGMSYPVNKLGLKYGKDTLSKNFRKLTEIKNDLMHVTVVKVGAMFVNSIELIHEHEHLTKGQEMAYFTFGSTVILLFEKDRFQIEDSLHTPEEVKVGQKIGSFK